MRGREESMVSWRRSVGRRVGEFLDHHLRWGVEGILSFPSVHFLLGSEFVEWKGGGCVREWPRLH